MVKCRPFALLQATRVSQVTKQWLSIKRVVIYGDGGVERKELIIAINDQRVDLNHGAVVLFKRLQQIL